MNYVVAIIQPQKLDAVREALNAAGIPGITVTDAQGCGRQKGHAEVYRGAEYTMKFVRKVKIEIACASVDLDKVVQAISATAKTGTGGKVGDGKIFIFDLKETIRIRTGEHGEDAV